MDVSSNGSLSSPLPSLTLPLSPSLSLSLPCHLSLLSLALSLGTKPNRFIQPTCEPAAGYPAKPAPAFPFGLGPFLHHL